MWTLLSETFSGHVALSTMSSGQEYQKEDAAGTVGLVREEDRNRCRPGFGGQYGAADQEGTMCGRMSRKVSGQRVDGS